VAKGGALTGAAIREAASQPDKRLALSCSSLQLADRKQVTAVKAGGFRQE